MFVIRKADYECCLEQFHFSKNKPIYLNANKV